MFTTIRPAYTEENNNQSPDLSIISMVLTNPLAYGTGLSSRVSVVERNIHHTWSPSDIQALHGCKFRYHNSLWSVCNRDAGKTYTSWRLFVCIVSTRLCWFCCAIVRNTRNKRDMHGPAHIEFPRKFLHVRRNPHQHDLACESLCNMNFARASTRFHFSSTKRVNEIHALMPIDNRYHRDDEARSSKNTRVRNVCLTTRRASLIGGSCLVLKSYLCPSAFAQFQEQNHQEDFQLTNAREIYKTASGLQYVDIVLGAGDMPRCACNAASLLLDNCLPETCCFVAGSRQTVRPANNAVPRDVTHKFGLSFRD